MLMYSTLVSLPSCSIATILIGPLKSWTCTMISLLTRIFTSFSPPVAEKKIDAIRFGILGAAEIA